MSCKLKVEELRAQLSRRGLDTSGTKQILLRRLDNAIMEEKTSLPKKRKREDKLTDHGDENEVESKNGNSLPPKSEIIKSLSNMNVRELQKELEVRGLLTSGLKKELIERLTNSMEMDGDLTKEDSTIHDVDECKEEKLVKATKKGGAILDQWLSDDIKLGYHVLQIGDEIYDAVLNQTNVGQNNNKFYVIQALEADSGGKYMVYTRWGRVGVRGQDKLFGPYTSRDCAANEFQSKFVSKTKNSWSDRKNFIPYAKSYTWLEMDYSEDTRKNKADQDKHNNCIVAAQPRKTRLDWRIAEFISLICNVSMMKQQMLEIGYNAEKLPLGKLSKSTITKGYDVLKRIADVIGQPDRHKLEQLSGEFYTVIPHDFGFKKMREFVIDTPQILKRKLEMVEALAEIEVATKLLEDDLQAQEDPLYSHYGRLHCELVPLEADSQEFSLIEQYMRNTHAETHSYYTVDIVRVFKVSRETDNERFRKFSSTKNKLLLWHGSRLSNWTGILSQGLRIAPPEAPVTGYMFGKGVYFADMFSKSANYCYSSHSSRAGVLLLCEVALGDMAELLTANCNADQLPEGKLSTKGVGATTPDPSGFCVLEDGVIVPLGKPKKQPGPQGSLLYNEYIVYNVDQIRMRYVLQVNFNFKH
ncbi:hypothetical protein AMTRI_Chr02g265080 [Amborella trichopoda]